MLEKSFCKILKPKVEKSTIAIVGILLSIAFAACGSGKNEQNSGGNQSFSISGVWKSCTLASTGKGYFSRLLNFDSKTQTYQSFTDSACLTRSGGSFSTSFNVTYVEVSSATSAKITYSSGMNASSLSFNGEAIRSGGTTTVRINGNTLTLGESPSVIYTKQ